MAVTHLMASRNPTALSVDFGGEEDVLYVSLGAPVASYADEQPDGILLRHANDTGFPSGVTALDFRANWRDRRREFYTLVADYLGVPQSLVRDQIERSI